jgi:glyoxylase-like metal-dependent hydrolase (beta-lactamase superfamily II)
MTDTTPHLDERLRRPSGIRTLKLGDTKLSYVPDGRATLNARMLLPEPTEEFWAQHAGYLDEDGHLMASVGGLLVERDGRALLIDAGAGPISMGPPLNTYGVITGGTLLDNLATVGRSPADIEAVALTHLHADHFGWAWHPAPGSDRPAFAHAPHLVAEPEWTQRHFPEAQGMGDMIKALEPQVRTMAEGEEIFPGVTVRFAPGHSAGHAAYVISAGGQRVIVFGDAFHTPSRSPTRCGRTPSTTTTSRPPACATASSTNWPDPTPSATPSTSPSPSAASASRTTKRPGSPSTPERGMRRQGETVPTGRPPGRRSGGRQGQAGSRQP